MPLTIQTPTRTHIAVEGDVQVNGGHYDDLFAYAVSLENARLADARRLDLYERALTLAEKTIAALTA